jgi:hypothetical protein
MGGRAGAPPGAPALLIPQHPADDSPGRQEQYHPYNARNRVKALGGNMAGRRRSWKRIVLYALAGLVVLFGVIQLVPYGRDHTNPPAGNPFKWTNAQAEAIAKKSCYDCHSNETDWWWATNIAPFSWLVTKDVNEGRDRMNFSDWQGGPDVGGFQESLGGMPPFQYTIIHPSTKLNDAQKKTLTAGYGASLSQNQAQPSSGTSSGSTAALDIIQSQCSSCHSGSIAVNYRAGADQASQMIDDMVQRGAQVTAAQKQTLVQYFTQ